MAFPRNTVTGNIALPGGSSLPDGARIIFKLVTWDKDDDTVALPGHEVAVVSDGSISISLIRSGSTDRMVGYLVGYKYWNPSTRQNDEGWMGRIAIVGAGTKDLAALLSDAPMPPPTIPNALAQAIAAADAALNFAQVANNAALMALVGTGAGFDSVRQMLDSEITYGENSLPQNGTTVTVDVSEDGGDTWVTKDGFAFLTLPSGGTPYDLVNAGGVRLVFANNKNVRPEAFGAIVGNLAATNAAIASAHAYLSRVGGGNLIWSAEDWEYTYVQPPENVRWIFEGERNRAQMGGANTSVRYGTSIHEHVAGPHATSQWHTQHIRTIAEGSGQIGAQYADYCFGLTVEKENWNNPASANAGEINNMILMFRNGVATGGDKTGGAAILADIGQLEGSGYVQLVESNNQVWDAAGNLIRKINVQLNGIDEHTGDRWGTILRSDLGSQSGAIRISSVAGQPWGDILFNQKAGVTNFRITDEGEIRWRAGSLGIFFQQDAANNWLNVVSESGGTVAKFRQNGFGHRVPVDVRAAGGATLDLDTHLGATVVMIGASAQTLTLPSTAPVGWSCQVVQRDEGQVTCSPFGSATLRARGGANKLAGQYAVATLQVLSNTGGSAAIWYLSGDITT